MKTTKEVKRMVSLTIDDIRELVYQKYGVRIPANASTKCHDNVVAPYCVLRHASIVFSWHTPDDDSANVDDALQSPPCSTENSKTDTSRPFDA